MSTQAKQNIHLALAAILKDIEAIAKDKKNEAQGFKFRGIDDVYNNLHPIFAAHGVICLPSIKSINSAAAGTTTKGAVITRTQVTMGYLFMASDGSSVAAEMVGEGLDSGDKSTAKAMSVAHKYLLLQTFLIPTADIVDGDYYDPTVDPREELKSRDAEAKKIVLAGGKAEDIPLPNDGEEKLAAKRAALEKSIAEREAKEKEENAVLGKKPAKAAKTPPKPAKEPEPPEEEEETEEEGDEQEEEGEREEWEDYKISQITIAKYIGKKLSELAPADIKGLKVSWADRYADKIKLNPVKVKESEMLNAAFNHHFAE